MVVEGLEDANVTAGASVIRVYLTGTGSEDGSESLSVTVAEGSVYDGAGNVAPHADGVGVSAVSTGLVDLFDLTPPVLSDATLSADNLYIDLLFDAGVYGDSESGTAVSRDSFSIYGLYFIFGH